MLNLYTILSTSGPVIVNADVPIYILKILFLRRSSQLQWDRQLRPDIVSQTK